VLDGFARIKLHIEEGGVPLAGPVDARSSNDERRVRAIHMLSVGAAAAVSAGARTTGNVQGLPIVFDTARLYFGYGVCVGFDQIIRFLLEDSVTFLPSLYVVLSQKRIMLTFSPLTFVNIRTFLVENTLRADVCLS
jgi:hypothetical protein